MRRNYKLLEKHIICVENGISLLLVHDGERRWLDIVFTELQLQQVVERLCQRLSINKNFF